MVPKTSSLSVESFVPSRSTLGRWVQHGAKRARRVLPVLDAACRPLVRALCLDEIFFHRKPVLMGIEPGSMAWVLGQRAPDRSGPTWAKALAAWPQVHDVAADGGSGLKLGIVLARAARPEQAPKNQVPPVALHARLDVFHIRQAGESWKTVTVSRTDLDRLEMAFVALWRFIHQLHADLDHGADIRFHVPAMRLALDRALQDYIDWRLAKQAWDTRRGTQEL